MRKTILIAVVAAVLAGGTFSSARANGYQDGIWAFKKENYPAAVELLTPYAKKGSTEAAFLLGEIYGPRSWSQKGENRYGVEQDNAQAIYWWTEAAKAGHAQAQLKLGWWLMHGQGVVEKNETEGMAWLVKSATQGEPQAMYEAGLGYWKATGVEKDLVQAYKWLDLVSGQDAFEAAKGYKDEVAKEMSPEQLSKAQALVKEWAPQ